MIFFFEKSQMVFRMVYPITENTAVHRYFFKNKKQTLVSVSSFDLL
jgi:hypothetical protein